MRGGAAVNDHGIHVGGDATGNFIIGDHNTAGDVTSAGRAEAVAEVRALLAALRQEVADKPEGTPSRESALDVLDDLDAELVEDEPNPQRTQRLLTRLSERLGGGLALATSAAELAEKVRGLFG